MNGPDGRLRLYVEHRAALVEYAKPLVGCAARAEDVVQEAWIKFAPAAEVAHPLGYLYRTVRNAALDMRRKLLAEGRHVAAVAVPDSIAEPISTPEDHVADRQKLRIVIAALDDLPCRTRMAFDLHRFQGLTFPEIGKRLGISVGLAHQLVQAALTHCAKRLAKLEYPSRK